MAEFIPSVFTNAFYQHLGRKRLYPLTGFLSALILQKIFSILSDSLLILFLNLSKELRDFCGFSKVPDAPLFTRFKQDFESYIELMFKQMVDYTESICQLIDSSLANILTFDTSGIELFVSENNPKTLNALIKKLKTFCKDKPDVDPYKMAYGLMPSQAASCSDAKYVRNVHLILADNPRLFNDPPRGSEEWKLEFNARTSAERCNKREKIDYKLEDGRYRSSMMWYCRLFAIMMCQHLDAWSLSKFSPLKELFKQAA